MPLPVSGQSVSPHESQQIEAVDLFSICYDLHESLSRRMGIESGISLHASQMTPQAVQNEIEKISQEIERIKELCGELEDACNVKQENFGSTSRSIATSRGETLVSIEPLNRSSSQKCKDRLFVLERQIKILEALPVHKNIVPFAYSYPDPMNPNIDMSGLASSEEAQEKWLHAIESLGGAPNEIWAFFVFLFMAIFSNPLQKATGG